MTANTSNPPSAETYRLSLEEAPRPEDVACVRAGLDAYNRQFAPDDGFKPLTILLRAADGTVMGGLLGGTYWGWLHTDILWLDERARGQDWGTRLLQMAEQEAVRRGCHHAHLDTMSFQAQPFYERQGYTVFGVLDDLPAGHRRIFLQKALTAVA